MNTESHQKLFLEKLNSMSTDELIQRLDEVEPTGLGDMIDDRRVCQDSLPPMEYKIDIVGLNRKTQMLIEKLKQERIPASGCRYFTSSCRVLVPVSEVSDALNLMGKISDAFGKVVYDQNMKAIVFIETECRKSIKK